MIRQDHIVKETVVRLHQADIDTAIRMFLKEHGIYVTEYEIETYDYVFEGLDSNNELHCEVTLKAYQS